MAEERTGPAQLRSWLPWSIEGRAGGLAVAGVLLATGLLFAWQASLLDFGSVGLPGPGFFPFLLGAALAGICAVILVKRAAYTAGDGNIELGHRDVLIAFAALMVIPIAFEPLGAYLTLGLFSTVLLTFIGRVHPFFAALAAAFGMAFVWYGFNVLLGLQLPSGPF
jgi:hypothetical protein